MRKPTKTISGITPVAVMLPARKCKHGACVYCPSLNVPQSYTPKSPAVMRAMNLNYNPYEQTKQRIKMFKSMGHPTDKIELIIMGGTFLQYPEKFQKEFVKQCFDAMNNSKSKNLELAQKKNEKAKHRCVALCIETRPDVCDEKHIKLMREYGATRVELGVQILDNKIYKKINRGHTVQDVVDATKRLKNHGFKIGYHIMPGLPGSNPKKDFNLFKKLFTDTRFKPDQLKIYPCQVMPGSKLENWYWAEKFKPYSKNQIQDLLVKILKAVPRYCRVMRIMREIPPEYIVAGTIHIDLRKHIEHELRQKKNKLNEIRWREVGFNILHSQAHDKKPTDKTSINLVNNKKSATTGADNIQLKATKYKASEGDEYFLELTNSEDILFGLLRLRIFDDESNSLCSPKFASLRSEINNSQSSPDLAPPPKYLSPPQTQNRSTSSDCSLKNFNDKSKLLQSPYNSASQKTQFIKNQKISEPIGEANKKRAIIRELHVYGPALEIGKKGKISQHRGFGKCLMREAEKIAKQNNCEKISVISGVGVRQYYQKLGYKLEKNYTKFMVKNL